MFNRDKEKPEEPRQQFEALREAPQPHRQTRLRTIRFMVPSHMDHRGFDFGVVFPFTDVTQPTRMEAISEFLELPKHIDWQDVLDNIGLPLFTLQPILPELQEEIYVPAGMGSYMAGRYRKMDYDYRRVPQGRDMSLLDLLVSRMISTKMSLDWLFDPEMEHDHALHRLGFIKDTKFEDDPWYRTSEEVFTMLRQLGGQGMRRQGDFVLDYAVSRTSLPDGELRDFLLLPLTTIEHFVKGKR